MAYTFTRTGAQIEEIHNTVDNINEVVGGLTSYQSETLSKMIDGIAVGGGSVVINENQEWVTNFFSSSGDEVGNSYVTTLNKTPIRSNSGNIYFKTKSKESEYYEIAYDLPVRGIYHDDIESISGTVTLSPQGLAIDSVTGNMFIQYDAVGGSPSSWVYVYDEEGVVLSAFALSTEGSEGAHVYDVGGVNYLVKPAAGSGSIELYELPVDLATINLTTISPTKVIPTPVGSQCGGYGDYVVFEHKGISNKGGTDRRNGRILFRVSDLVNEVTPVAISAFIMSISDTDRNNTPKTQSICITDSGYASVVGNGWSAGNPSELDISKLVGHKEFNNQGELVRSNVLSPISLSENMVAKGFTNATFMEGQGIAYGKVAGNTGLHVLINTIYFANTGNTTGGLTIFRKSKGYGVPLPDVTTYVQGTVLNKDNYNPYNVSAPIYNPLDGEKFTTSLEIVKFMRAAFIGEYSFYSGNGQQIKDAVGVDIPDAMNVKITNPDGFRAYVEFWNVNDYTKQFISGNTGSKSQVEFGRQDTPDGSRGVVIIGQDDKGLIDMGVNATTQQPVARFFNPNGQGGSISIAGSATVYATSSDPRLKTEFEEHLDPWGDFYKIHDSLGVFGFKAQPEHKVLGFNAHKIIDHGFDAGVEGVGPRDLSIGEAFNTEVINHDDGTTENIVEKVTPAGVDQSKIVPYLVSVIHDLNERLKALEVK